MLILGLPGLPKKENLSVLLLRWFPMRQVSIVTVLMAASIVGMVAPAQAVKVTYSTLVTSDPASQGGKKFTIPVFSPKQPTVKINKVAKQFSAPSIDQQGVIFVAKTDPVPFGTAGRKFDVNAVGLFYEFSGDLKTVDSRMEINDDITQPYPPVTTNYDSPDIEGVNVAYRAYLTSSGGWIRLLVAVNLPSQCLIPVA
jgi:hypothetical protein